MKTTAPVLLAVWLILGTLTVGVLCAGPKDEAPKRVTTITSQTLSYDYSNAVAIFEKDVVVLDQEMKMTSDRMVVRFEGTNNVKSVHATGHVRLQNGLSRGRCQQAFYDATIDKITLRGEAQLEKDTSFIQADTITFFIRNKEVHSVRATGDVRMRHTDTGKAGPLFPSSGLREKTP